MKRVALLIVALTVLGGAGIAAACAAGIVTPPYVGYASVWSVAVCEFDGPFDGRPLEMKSARHITAAHVTDIEAQFVADPFLMHRDGTWYLFYEVLNGETGEGDISLSTSTDGKNWQYQQVVLDEDFHLSYPQIFEHNGEIYMVPESWQAGGVRLYRATNFPTEWQHERTLIEGPLVDATLVQHDGRWWMFASRNDSWDSVQLFHADSLLEGEWQEHPQSPIVDGDAHTARPGGRILKQGDRLFRIAQDDAPTYGRQLWAFEINRMTTEEYHETLACDEPILAADGDGWNGIGMHHLDLHVTEEGKRFACVDGLQRVLCLGPITVGK